MTRINKGLKASIGLNYLTFPPFLEKTRKHPYLNYNDFII